MRGFLDLSILTPWPVWVTLRLHIWTKAVIETRKKVLGLEHPDTLVSMGNLAVIFRIKAGGMRPRSQRYKSWMTRKRVLGLEHLDTLTRMSILASTLLNQGLWKEAEQLETQVVETSFRMLGLEHPARDAGQHGWPCINTFQSRPVEGRRGDRNASHGDKKEVAGTWAFQHADEHGKLWTISLWIKAGGRRPRSWLEV